MKSTWEVRLQVAMQPAKARRIGLPKTTPIPSRTWVIIGEEDACGASSLRRMISKQKAESR